MLQIPSLTARELDIAPLLIANATRNEIARHFGISEETVKHHTRNILRKFEATNIRDAYEALSNHLYVFGKDELNQNYFYQSFNRNLYLSENRIDAFVEDIILIEAIYHPMTEYVSEYYTTTGKVENIHVDGEPFDVHERVSANTASTKIIDPALQSGETITVKQTADYVGVFPENIEWLSVLVAQPKVLLIIGFISTAMICQRTSGNITIILQSVVIMKLSRSR
jgi:DNA-binding CsgD family transcriptional regulator